MRENLISKVIGIQQMFEKPKGPRLRNLWTDRRMKLIKNMGQIQSILKSMKEKPKKKKKKKPKVILPPVVESEKPKPLPEGFVNFSKLLPRVDPKTMETRSFTWSRERDTCLIDKYVGQEHMKDQALREHTLGIKPILKIGEWNKLFLMPSKLKTGSASPVKKFWQPAKYNWVMTF